MGLRRLRGRLDQVQGAANLTLQDARDLLADLADGFGVTVTIDATAAKILFQAVVSGTLHGKIDLPISLRIDPSSDTKQ